MIVGILIAVLFFMILRAYALINFHKELIEKTCDLLGKTKDIVIEDREMLQRIVRIIGNFKEKP